MDLSAATICKTIEKWRQLSILFNAILLPWKFTIHYVMENTHHCYRDSIELDKKTDDRQIENMRVLFCDVLWLS